MNELLSTDQLATRWGISPGTLRNWRTKKTGPPYIKLGDAKRSVVMYSLADILKYEKKFTRHK